MSKAKEDLTGRIFGKIEVVEDAGGQKVLCKCRLCGGQKMMDRYNIRRASRIAAGHGCGCKRTEAGRQNAKKLAETKDLTSRTIGNVRVIEWTGRKKGTQKVYKCECLRCGRIFETRGAELTRGSTTSCGCLATDIATERVTSDCIGGTKISALSTAPRSDNSSGVVGVCFTSGRWVSYIGFCGKRYVLYQGPDKDEAICRRKEAEKSVRGDFFEWLKEELRSNGSG